MKHWLLAAVWIVGWPQHGVEAEPEDRDARPGPGSERPALSLDSLLSPRAGEWELQNTLRGGRDRETWRREFDDARAEVDQLEGQVDALQVKLREASDGAEWSYSPAGAGDASDPEILKLRASLRRDRGSLETAHTRLRELEVEASLAEVPDHWVDPEP